MELLPSEQRSPVASENKTKEEKKKKAGRPAARARLREKQSLGKFRSKLNAILLAHCAEVPKFPFFCAARHYMNSNRLVTVAIRAG